MLRNPAAILKKSVIFGWIFNSCLMYPRQICIKFPKLWFLFSLSIIHANVYKNILCFILLNKNEKITWNTPIKCVLSSFLSLNLEMLFSHKIKTLACILCTVKLCNVPVGLHVFEATSIYLLGWLIFILENNKNKNKSKNKEQKNKWIGTTK